VKGFDWLGDQDAIEFMCKEAPAARHRLEHYGVPSHALRMAGIYQRPFGGYHALAQGHRAAHLRGGGPHRSPMLHTLYQQSLKHEASFFIEYFALDLIMENGECRGVIALDMAEGHAASVARHKVILATGGYGRAWFSWHSALPAPAMAVAWRCAPIAAAGLEFVQFHPTGIYGAGCLITEGFAREGGYLTNAAATIHGTLRAEREGLGVARCGQADPDHRDPRGPRRRQAEGSHSSASGNLARGDS